MGGPEQAIQTILDRHKKLRPKVGYPGDFGERAFRLWLVLDLLLPVYGWTHERVVAGEFYDLLLLDRRDRCVVTIETKNPGHRPNRADVLAFEARLHHFPTLSWAYFTDGSTWRRLRLMAPAGTQSVADDESASLSDPKALSVLLEPLRARDY